MNGIIMLIKTMLYIIHTDKSTIVFKSSFTDDIVVAKCPYDGIPGNLFSGKITITKKSVISFWPSIRLQ